MNPPLSSTGMSTSNSAVRDAIVADPRASLPMTHQFLAAYFHQDWMVDNPQWPDAVDDFVAESTRPSVAGTAAEIRRLAGAGFDEPTLRAVLEGLDCGLDPAGVGLDAESWLAAVIERLDR